MLDDIEQHGGAEGCIGKGNGLRASLHAFNAFGKFGGRDGDARARDCLRLGIERDCVHSLPGDQASEQRVARTDIDHPLRAGRRVGHQKGGESVGAPSVGVVGCVEVPVVGAALVVFFEGSGCAPNCCIPAQSCQRWITGDGVEIAGIGGEAEVRAEVRAGDLVVESLGFHQRVACVGFANSCGCDSDNIANAP